MVLEIDGRPVDVVVEIPRGRSGRRRGLLGRDGFTSALVLTPCRQVHTVGMRFPIDVAFCDAGGRVRHVATLAPGRVSRWVPSARMVVEAAAGSFARWGVRRGVTVAVREHAGHES